MLAIITQWIVRDVEHTPPRPPALTSLHGLGPP